MDRYLQSSAYFDYNADEIQNIIDEFRADALSNLEKAKRVYLKIRDTWRYNPYTISVDPNDYRASKISQKKDAHCVDKAILLTTCLRALGVPARLRLSKVTNHIAVERLTERFGSNVLTPHGMVDVFLNGNWVKATPAFNKELCELNNVAPLEFDGERDSVFQEFNADGKRFMEYIEDYGHFDDVPFEFMAANLKSNYPNVFKDDDGIVEYRF